MVHSMKSDKRINREKVENESIGSMRTVHQFIRVLSTRKPCPSCFYGCSQEWAINQRLLLRFSVTLCGIPKETSKLFLEKLVVYLRMELLSLSSPRLFLLCSAVFA
mmetsp:Transcript_7061/g.20510  ORF Transcript_7061/g.20510 Transcript_7061/m.20510 type:complete len:106 (+) Transcript_7061:3423-3740(+)